MENKYKKAIENFEVEDFFFGRGRYLYVDRERNNMHNISLTSIDILEYKLICGNEKMLLQFKKDKKNA
ncbi:MAG: hypothetical protein BGO86_03525 [Chryseobacterium sp. 36-9]|nr:MAG: hypothetical protein BGO86_03525 [Chryseobacterium sp. 36-9]